MVTKETQMQTGKTHYRFKNEAGVSLTGLIVVLAVLGALALVAIKVTPAWLEYRAVKEAIVKAKASGGSVREIQQAFDKNAGINDVNAISGRDLVISRDTGETEISFAYEKRVPLTGNVSLLFDFAGTTDPHGVVAKAEAAQ
jgi:type II secretory pathway pseudopilin PulG